MGTQSSSGSKDRYAGLGRLLRSRREELGRSRSEVAEIAGLSYPYIAQLEGGYRAPSPSAALGLAEALELPVEELLLATTEDAKPRAAENKPGLFPNPNYADGIASSEPRTPRVGNASESDAPRPPRGRPASQSPASAADLSAVAEDVIRLLNRLPPDSRLDVLALAQSRVMKDMVRYQVRQATER